MQGPGKRLLASSADAQPGCHMLECSNHDMDKPRPLPFSNTSKGIEMSRSKGNDGQVSLYTLNSAKYHMPVHHHTRRG